MRTLQQQNQQLARQNPHENWMYKKLKTTGHRWTRQKIYGYRIFDFWSFQLGVAVEVDGNTHDPITDERKDENLFRHTGIVTLRVRNADEERAELVLKILAEINDWKERKIVLGINRNRSEMVGEPDNRHFLSDYIQGLISLVEG